MNILFVGIGMISAGLIFWQDFKNREIHIFWLLLFCLSGISFLFFKEGVLALSILIPSYVLVSLILLILVFLTKKISGQTVMDKQLGWGDVFMLYGLASWWETFEFLIFYTLSLWILTSLFFLGQKIGSIPKNYPIPLAGAWAWAFIIFFPMTQLYPLETFLP